MVHDADPWIMLLFGLTEHDSPGDVQPERHVVGLSGPDVVAVVALLERHGAALAPLTEDGTARTADGITVGDVEIPTLSMFLLPDAIQFFWEAGPPWTERSAGAFVELLGLILDVAPGAPLRPDPLFAESARRRIAEALTERLGRRDRIDLSTPS